MLKKLRGLFGRTGVADADVRGPAPRGAVGDAGGSLDDPAIERLLYVGDADALHAASRSLAEAGRIDAAQRCLERAVAIHPDSPALLTDLGKLLRARGDDHQAAARFRDALAIDPAFVPALANLGAAILAQGDAAGASAILGRAADIAPADADIQRVAGVAAHAAGDLANAGRRLSEALALRVDAMTARALGEVLDAQGLVDRADDAIAAIADRHPDEPALLELLGVRALGRGDPERAIVWFERAIDASPPSAALHSNLGLACLRARRLDDAIDSLETAIALDGNCVPAYRNLGLAFAEARQWEESDAAFAKALAIDPSDAETCAEHGRALHKAHRLDQAASAFAQAVRLRPAFHDARVRLGLVLCDLGRTRDAGEAFERALDGGGQTRALAQIGLGLVALDGRRVEEALARFEEALASGAGVNDEAKWNITRARLLAGDWERAWEFYDLRWQAEVARRPFAYPEWNGGDLAGKTLLAYAEQGLGDEIMFASCYPELARRAGHLVIDCSPRLAKLFQRSFPEATVVGSSQAATPEWLRSPPHIDLQAAAGTVAARMRRSAASFPAHSGYLRADPGRVAHWRSRLDALGPGAKIGISWRGGTPHSRTHLRSTRLADWAPILNCDGAHFISLQYHTDAGEEVAAAHRESGVRVHHWQAALDDYDETAAMVTALDMVVTVCTAVVHLGGALGKPVRVIVPATPEWRYGVRGDRMPWYPSVRLHRQSQPGQWSEVLREVAAAVREEFGLPVSLPLRAPT